MVAVSLGPITLSVTSSKGHRLVYRKKRVKKSIKKKVTRLSSVFPAGGSGILHALES